MLFRSLDQRPRRTRLSCLASIDGRVNTFLIIEAVPERGAFMSRVSEFEIRRLALPLPVRDALLVAYLSPTVRYAHSYGRGFSFK